MRWSFFVWIIIWSLMPFTVHTQNIPGACETDTLAAQQTWIPRFLPDVGEIRLVDYVTGEVVHLLATDIMSDTFNPMAWSLDCRYFAGHIGNFKDTTLVVWDTETGSPVNQIANLYLYEFRFAPDNAQALVETRSGAFLWHFVTGRRVQLTETFLCFGRSFGQVAWDFKNNQFMGVQADYTCRTPNRPVQFFDLDTGVQVAQVEGNSFVWLEEGETILVSGIRRYPVSSLAFYDVRSRTLIELPIYYGYLRDYRLYDDRFLLIAQYGLHLFDLETGKQTTMDRSEPYSDWTIEVVNFETNMLRASYREESFTWNLATGDLREP